MAKQVGQGRLGTGRHRRNERTGGAEAGRCPAPSCRGGLDEKIEGLLSAAVLGRDDLDSLIAALEQRYGADLRRQLRKFIASRGGATTGFDEDAVQEMWVRAAHDLAGANRRYLKDIRSWLVRIAKNCAIDHIRRRRSEMAALRGFFRIADHTFPDPAEAASDRERSDRLERGLDRLNPLDRTILRSWFFEGQSSFDIAKKLGIPPSTVRGKRQRALARLKALIGCGGDAAC